MEKRKKQLQLIWGMAKELGMSKEDVYTLLYRETRKEHMRDCSEVELSRTIQAMILLKERQKNRPGMMTGRQRYRIRELEKELGWQDNKKRLTAFIKKYYHVDNLDWLKTEDASSLIESLKKLAEKQQEEQLEAVRP